jgi:integrase/recombinase XerD
MTDSAISPLRQRMIEDMTIRKLTPKTQHDYVQRVKNFAVFLGRSPDTASFEDVRRYQLHLATSGAGVPTLNQSISTLRFFFKITLGRADIVNHTQFIHVFTGADPLCLSRASPQEWISWPQRPVPRCP